MQCNPADLEAGIKLHLGQFEQRCPLCRKPLNRRYIVTEGVFAATGELAPLADIHRLKHKYRYRMLVDESFSLGVLGVHGRGACERAGLGPSDVEIVCASLGGSAL